MTADAEIIRRLQARDERALAELMARLRPKLFLVAMSRIHNREDAEEIVSKTFLNAWERIGQFRGDSSLETWLIRITMNLSFNRWWYWQRRRRDKTLALDHPIGENDNGTFHDLMPADALGVQRELELRETAVAVDQAINELRPNARRAILDHRAGLSYLQMAASWVVDEGTVKSRIARARAELRLILDRRSKTYCDLVPERAA